MIIPVPSEQGTIFDKITQSFWEVAFLYFSYLQWWTITKTFK